MKSRLASVRPSGGLDRVDSAVQLLEEEWRRNGDVRFEKFWADQIRNGAVDSTDSLVLLTALIKADLRVRFDQGQSPTADGYLRTFPELRGSESRVLSLVYEEYCLREEQGSAPEVDSFCERYPEWKRALAAQLRYHQVFSQAAGLDRSLPRFPEPGENFEEFHLLSDLGRGGTSRVFLARDLSLGGKQVVLKVTLDRGQEPKAQGALDHPHIVPVNAVIYPAQGRLCGLSMPFRPGLPLDEVIRRVKPAERPGRAMALWVVLGHESTGRSGPDSSNDGEKVDAKTPGGPRGPRGDGWEGFPTRGTYAQGAAWVATILARALQYAHSKQTYHRDVKPANVLLTLKYGPQLLDFNLAESPHSVDRARAALRGGTPPYMAPEQIEAFLDPERRDKVGAQADVYSLGLVLRELLTGQMPEMPPKRLSPAQGLLYLLDRRPILDVGVRRVNPAIPHSLAAIVEKCLAFAPDDRYRTAEALAQDLERYLSHRPLLTAVNPSRPERVSNLLRRHCRALTAACIIVVGVVATGLLVSGGLLSPSSNQTFKRSVERSVDASPVFQAAVGHVNKREYQRAVDLLSNLLKDYPRSSLLKLYLGLSLDSLAGPDDQRKKDEAQSYLRKAIAALDGESSLVEWAKGRPELAASLVDFAESVIIRADTEAEEYDVENLKDDEKRDRALRQKPYELAREVLQLAERLNPKLPTLERLLAKTDEIRSDYERAYNRLSGLIESVGSGAESRSLFFCRKLRGRVAFLWVESRKPERYSPLVDSLRLLAQASVDLNWCAAYLNRVERFEINEEGPESRILNAQEIQERRLYDKQLKVYRVLHDQARAMVTQAEVELENNLSDEAAKHLRACGRSITRLIEHANYYKLKVPKPTELTDRKEAGSQRLKGLGYAIRPDSRYSSNQAANETWQPR
jgi:serine/threonine protein kinase